MWFINALANVSTSNPVKFDLEIVTKQSKIHKKHVLPVFSLLEPHSTLKHEFKGISYHGDGIILTLFYLPLFKKEAEYID